MSDNFMAKEWYFIFSVSIATIGGVYLSINPISFFIGLTSTIGIFFLLNMNKLQYKQREGA